MTPVKIAGHEQRRPSSPVGIEEVMIAWDPAWLKGAARVAVGPHPDRTGWSARYAFTGGACYSEWRADDDRGRLLRLFIDFNTITVRDGVPPSEVHRAFLAIPEYRRTIASDQEGAES